MDLGAVLEYPGVAAVALAADVPGENNYGSAVHDDPIFAPDLVQYVGQPLFAVAADTYTTARKAARRLNNTGSSPRVMRSGALVRLSTPSMSPWSEA